MGNVKVSATATSESTVYPILFTISFAHLLNDLVQSVIPAIYPLLKDNYVLSFTQIGLITLTFQATASLLQPFVGYFTDKRPQPFSLAIGMGFSLLGLLLLASAASYWVILCAVALVGMGSSVFHPESSRVAYLASGGRRGFAQSVFQIGGNAGSAIGPLLVALVVMPYGQGNVRWFALGAMLAILALYKVGHWYRANIAARKASVGKSFTISHHGLSIGKVKTSVAILLVLIFSKYFYMACMTSYFTFFLIEKFQVSVATSQVYLFVFLAAIAAGTYLGGPMGDKYGRKYIIWISILGSAPFTLLLPHVGLAWVIILAVVIGVVLASAFSAILVYAQELLPGRVGMISGLFFGFAFGMGGLGSALLGKLADQTDIQFVFLVCSFLPLLGLITWLLPNLKEKKGQA
ncbi:MAG: MFS transporter [Lunatimonas sp.]|uniref:MFS transporter n=1 Tax=Lunatimonas sp. TaxID=2060141 RepID=UPI002A41E91B|nr:MFS transporter [Lunatimonas sp.]